MKKILFVIPRGEVIRNFVYSGIAKKLKENYHMVFFSVIPNESLREYLKSNCDELYELEQLKLTYAHRLLQEIMDLAHNRYLWSEAAKVRWNMRDVEVSPLTQKIARSIKKMLALLLANNKALTLLEKLDLWMASKNQQVKKYRSHVQRIQPDIVFNGSHSHSKIAYPLLQAARLEKIKTAGFLFSWDNLTSQGRVLPPHDYYLSWNEKIRQDLLDIYPSVKPENTFVSGTPQFVGHFITDSHLSSEEIKNRLSISPGEEYFVYSSGMSHHMPFEPYVVGRIADIIKRMGSKYRLVIRTYAKDRYDVFEELKAGRPDIIIPDVQWERKFQTPLIEDQIFFSSLLKHCIGGINVASTVSLELCMFDKPAINVGYNPPGKNIAPYNYTRFYSFDHYKPIVDSGAVQVAPNEEAMEELIKEAIEVPSKYHAERMALLETFFENRLGTDIPENFEKILHAIINEKG